MRKRLESPFCIYCEQIKKKPDNGEQTSRMETMAMTSDDQPDDNNFATIIRNKMQNVIMNLSNELENQSFGSQENFRSKMENMSLLLEMIDKTIATMKKL